MCAARHRVDESLFSPQVCRRAMAGRSADYDDLGGGEAARLNTYLPATPSNRKCVLVESSSEGLVDALKRAFVNERCAPELLPHQDDLVNDVKERINEQARAHEAACFPHFPLTLFRPRR